MGIQDGAWEHYYEIGNPKMSISYQAGRINGKVTTWYEEGMLESEKEYKGGLPHGEFRFYEKRGTEPKVIKFKDGKKVN